MSNLAAAYQDDGQITEAIEMLEQVRDIRLMELGPEDPVTTKTLRKLEAAILKRDAVDAVNQTDENRPGLSEGNR